MSEKRSDRLRVVVDLNLCQGYGQCCFAAPAHFWMHGPEALSYHPSPDAGEQERVRAAAAACPVQAIRIEDVAA